MSKQTEGKTLLRNVIRHTDAHNKIQEEMEMWKMRGWEMQMSHQKQLPFKDNVRGHMHCDRVSDPPGDVSHSRERASQHDDREARYWTRKLYEFEAGDPDRWGHSGFKELYPEEFESDDGEKSAPIKKACKRKKSTKKSSRKKKKKKKKKADDRKKRDDSSSSGESSDESSGTKDKPRKRKRAKSRHKNKRSRRRDEDSSSWDSNEDKSKRRGFKKRKRVSESDSGSDFRKKKRKDWKAADGESSDDSSAD
ncbi:uncharacterized protein NKAPD1 [Oryzias melastigma]|uniref:NKAP domain containing 1 n=1 Tax=Oryzias melastigma TaxID=30732 RepID=A0A3B3BF51_ORYME|nr:uncharacterized protein NKAPD1 [Oryzias melastigma]XP_024133791.1 uncharacterized protein NKAPD1 [Oryzias melastigma]